jgi:hypothetical protein
MTDGEQAVNVVTSMGGSSVPVPSLVFLDLKLPFVSGFEVLASMRASQNLRDVPIVILTSSPEERDQQKALELGATGYRVKPPTDEMLREVAAMWDRSK